MSNRTRSSAKHDNKKSKNILKKVSKWEKKWVTIEDTNLRVLRWVQIPPEIVKEREARKQAELETQKQDLDKTVTEEDMQSS